MEKCTHPHCDYTAPVFISNNHCNTEHNMTKKELYEQYGKPVKVKIDSAKLKENMILFHGEWNEQSSKLGIRNLKERM